MITYGYEVGGTAAGGQTWTVRGSVTVASAGMFHQALELIQGEAFQKLANGKAVFGNPGIGCRGPYRYTRFVVQEFTQ